VGFPFNISINFEDEKVVVVLVERWGREDIRIGWWHLRRR
jgi:hypothetical protein